MNNKLSKTSVVTAALAALIVLCAPKDTLADGSVITLPQLDAQSSNPVSNAGSSFGVPPVSDTGTDLSASSPSGIVFDPNMIGQDYVLGPGDVFNVIVHPQTDYSVMKLVVNQDGTIDYPRVGVFPVSGETLTKAKQDIIQKLSDFCIQPDVSLSLVALRPAVVYVTGGVASYHILDVRAASNVAKAITLAGGATDRNELLNVAVLRGDSVLHSNVYPLLVNGNLGEGNNIDLQAGDIIVVPINTDRFAISGAISHPGLFPLNLLPGSNEGVMHLSDAIASAGGTIDGVSNISSIRIVRMELGKPVSAVYDYGKALKGDQSQNPVIENHDSIYVPDKSKHIDPFQIPTFIYLFKVLGI